MKLTFEQIRSVCIGAISAEERDGTIYLTRTTQKQIDAWKERSEAIWKNSQASTGIRLDFYTNSQTFAFKSLQGSYFEVMIDGHSTYFVKTEGEYVDSFELCDTLGARKDEYRVTFVFPSHGPAAILSYVELDDGAYARPCDYDMNMLFIGDSITQGWETTRDTYSYAYRTSFFFNANSVIQGIGGAYLHEDCFDHIDFDPDVVIVAYGTNDFSHYKTYDDLRAHSDEHFRLIANEYKGKKLFYISPIWRGNRDGKAMGSFEGCREILIEGAEKNGFIHIDGLTLVPPLPSLFADEYLHPNDNGFSFYAENLIKVLKKHI